MNCIDSTFKKREREKCDLWIVYFNRFQWDKNKEEKEKNATVELYTQIDSTIQKRIKKRKRERMRGIRYMNGPFKLIVRSRKRKRAMWSLNCKFEVNCIFKWMSDIKKRKRKRNWDIRYLIGLFLNRGIRYIFHFTNERIYELPI